MPPRHQTSHRICLIEHVVTVPDLERQTFNNCYEGPSLPGTGHVSPSVEKAWTVLAADLRTLEAFHMRCQRQISGIRWIDHISNATVSSLTGLASVGEQIASRRIAIFGHIASCVRRPQPTRLSVPTSTYHLVVCLVGTGSAGLIDQTTGVGQPFLARSQQVQAPSPHSTV